MNNDKIEWDGLLRRFRKHSLFEEFNETIKMQCEAERTHWYICGQYQGVDRERCERLREQVCSLLRQWHEYENERDLNFAEQRLYNTLENAVILSPFALGAIGGAYFVWSHL